MYFPYFRGKQYELIIVRETAKAMASAKFVPIISPVREQLRGLHKALDAVSAAGGQAVLIVNPEHGELAGDSIGTLSLLVQEFHGLTDLSLGIRLHSDMTADQAISMAKKANGMPIAFVHAGFSDGKSLVGQLGEIESIYSHIFMEEDCGKLYRKKFKAGDVQQILIRDGFRHRRNRDHPVSEFFSDLHVTYSQEEGANGFGDFLIVGDEYSESGGPAYAVAIHLTYIDPDQDDAMYVCHFLSDRQDTPMDPGGKFLEALEKVIVFLNGVPGGKFLESNAIAEFRDLHEHGHFPGLGYVKKLSMKHHVETLADYFKKSSSVD